MTIDLSQYISGNGDVFAIRNLPEEVIAVLFAYYSRSRNDLRTNLREMLTETGAPAVPAATGATDRASEKARAFHEKWTVGYSHASVAEHAVVHLGIENVSILAAKAIEDARLGSFTEKSTRYVQFDRDSPVDPPEFSADNRVTYRGACNQLLDTYAELMPMVMAEVARRSPGAKDAAIKAQALDAVRGLLPAGTRTSLGMTCNARTLAGLCRKMGGSASEEVRLLAAKLADAGRVVAPTLLRHTEPVERRGVPLASRTFFAGRIIEFYRWDSDALDRLASAIANEDMRPDIALAPSIKTVVRRELLNRGPHEPAPRAFEATSYHVALTLDYGAYRDLQRHRMLSPFTGLLSPRSGHGVPELVEAVGGRAQYVDAMGRAAAAWASLVDQPSAAQYVVPLGYRHRVLWVVNLRELIHVIELRSGRQGHHSYRRVAQELYREVIKIHPWLEGVIRVDMYNYNMARS
jgi:thymidylate synthase ThyX